MATIHVSESRLKDARDAYHALMLGQAPRVVVDQNGERVEFSAANKDRLYAYIIELESALKVSCGGTPVPNSALFPASFTF